jgi:LDH2 family malate/lactate/ureidoglycolate dehydrogenase
MAPRYAADDLRAFGSALFAGAGMPEDRAAVEARFLVEADLMGHDTHGLAHAPPYLAHLADGRMTAKGDYEVVSERGGNLLLDGDYLSGVWLVSEAMRLGFERVPRHGVVTLVIRRAHHIACLAAYLPEATARGLMIILASSDPSVSAVAPHGSHRAVYTPNPIAVGVPTDADPVLIDISSSTTTMALGNRLKAVGERFPGPWVIDNRGRATDDPAAVATEPPGAILPLGGTDLGHKGFGLGIFVEALTSALGGYGRAGRPTQWGAAVFLQLIDPACFGGRAAFARETGWLAEACRGAPAVPGGAPVRMPGDAALRRRRAALADGVPLHPDILPELQPWAERYGIEPPRPLSGT